MKIQIVTLLTAGVLLGNPTRGQQVLSSLVVSLPEWNVAPITKDETGALKKLANSDIEVKSGKGSASGEKLAQLENVNRGLGGDHFQDGPEYYFSPSHSSDGEEVFDDSGERRKGSGSDHYRPEGERGHLDSPHDCRAIPEPSTCAVLLGLGSFGLVLLRHRSRRAA